MSTQATIRFDVEASTARLGPQLKAGEQQLRMFGNAAPRWAADRRRGRRPLRRPVGLGTALGQIGSMTGSGSASSPWRLITAMTPISAMLRSSGGAAAEFGAPSAAGARSPGSKPPGRPWARRPRG